MFFYLLFLPVSFLSLLWSIANGSTQLLCATIFFTILYSGYGISVGYHRLHAHNSFETWEPIRKLLLYLGCHNHETFQSVILYYVFSYQKVSVDH